MLKRACLYLRRRYKRSILLFLLMFLISLSLLVGLSAWGSIDSITKEVQQRLGTSFIMKYPANEDYYRTETTDKSITRVYLGPVLNEEFAQQVMQIDDGIMAYNGTVRSLVYAETLEPFHGMYNILYQMAQEDPHWMENLIVNTAELGGLEGFDITRKSIRIYGNTDTSLYDKFRSGAFELVEGRYITPEDRCKVLVSEELAELNNLHIGDTFTVSVRGVSIGLYDNVAKNLGEAKLEVVGIFHVNGYQPTGRFVSESEITYNWLLADENIVKQFRVFVEQGANPTSEIDSIDDVKYNDLTFFVDNPARLNEIVEKVRQSDVENADFFDVALDDTMYKSTVEPLNSIRNLITGMMVALAAGCVVVLLIVFTLWVRDRRKEIAIYISMGLEKASIVGQLLLEAVIITAIAFAVAFPISQPLTDYAGNTMLASSIEAAQPDDTPKEYSLDELREAAMGQGIGKLFTYESSTYSGPEQIDFSLGAPELAALAALELLIIAGAICKGSMFLFRMAPKQILTDLR